ncbi:MAG: hypothetical protein ACE5JM_17465 [Armatimonadota bacterium]
MPRSAWLHMAVCVLLCGGVQAAPREFDPEIYVANREYPPAEAMSVAVLPFATGDHRARWSRTLAKQARARFKNHKFDLVPRKAIDAAVRKQQYGTERVLSDDALAEIGRELNADWVVHGKLLDVQASREAVLGLPVPTGKRAACVIQTKVVTAEDEDLVFRRQRELRGEVGSEWFTSDAEARSAVVRRCMRTLYDPLFERIPRRQQDAYKRRAYVRDDIRIDAGATTVALCRFVDFVGSAGTERTVTQASREAFADFGFQLVDAEKLEYARSKLPHDLRENHDDETLSELANSVDADVVVYGEIAYMQVSTKHVPLVRFQVPVPGRKKASCVLRTKVIDAKTQQVLYRSERRADNSLVGIQYLTSGGEARARVARQCVRYLYQDFFRAIDLAR